MKNLFLTFAIGLISCGTGNGVQSDPATHADTTAKVASTYDRSLPVGRIADSMQCKDKSQDFALYLPTSYTPEKTWPVIYLFDSHGLGVLPVSMYKDIAERYGFVLIGSNASKNGLSWDVVHDGVKELIADTRARIDVDPKRIYTVGFSGGSRVAVTVAVIDGVVAGVIGCAAGFPKVQEAAKGKFDYVGLVGDHDFNLSEMQQWDDALAQNGFAHQLITSGGIHGWAGVADFETAVLWLQVMAMKGQLQPKNDALITALYNDYTKRIAATKIDLIKNHELLDGMVRTLDGLMDMTAEKKQLSDLLVSDAYKKAVIEQNELLKQEVAAQQEMRTQTQALEDEWMLLRVAALNKKAQDKNDIQAAQMNARLLSYFGFVMYMTANQALGSNSLAHALACIQAFRKADPKNPDGPYLEATYHIKKGDAAKAIAALGTAAGMGYNDIGQLTDDPVFASLHNDPSYQKIIAVVRQNARAK